MANEFKDLGLQPFGDNGTFFQKVPLIKRSIVKPAFKVQSELDSKLVKAIYGDDITIIASSRYDKVDEKRDIVFVGYGNIIPEKNINDYEGLDVKGKIVIAVLGAPKSLKDYDAFNPFEKAMNAMSQGAEGLIIFFPKGLFQNAIFKKIHSYAGQPVMSLADTSISEQMFDVNFKIAAFAKKDFVNDLFKLNHLNLGKELRRIKKGEFASKELNSKLDFAYEIKVDEINCKNVVALLPGSDPTLKNEYVTVGAHLDHVGVGEPVKGDSIYNGMWDNATGASALLSIAKTYKQDNIIPDRSLVFIAYTGEEKGLLGSDYYAHYNEVKNEKIVANINIDMLGGLFPTKDIIPLGYSHSNLSEAVDYSAEKLGLVVNDNKQEEDEYLFRSDQASFLQIGVPVLNIANGYNAVDEQINGHKEIDKWMETLYHSPFDDIKQKYSKEAFYIGLKYNFLSIYYITNIMDDIKWNEDSWIYQRYVIM